MPPRKTRAAAAAEQSPRAERSSKRLAKKAEQEDVIALESGSEQEADEAPAAKPSTKRGLAEEQGTTPASKRQRKLPVRGRAKGGAQEEEVSSSEDDEKDEFVTPAVSKGKHIVFGDDDDDKNEKFYTPLEAPASKRNPAGSSHPAPVPEEDDEDEDEDSDDEAPEAVTSTKVAVDDSRKQAEKVAKALEQQEAARKRKRQERDALFRQQAETRKTTAQTSGGGRRRADKTGIPDLLPAEFLESDDEESEDEEAAAAAAALLAKPRKITFGEADRKLSKEGRPVRDQQVGSTVYRVTTDKRKQELAPKLQKYSRGTREEMLGRKRSVQKKGGFLVKRK